MLKQLIKLFNSTTASGDSLATSIIPVRCALVGVSWSIRAITTGTAGVNCTYQLSLQSTGQFGVNDARNVIDECQMWSDCLTTAANCGANKNTLLGGVQFEAGDKIYLHGLSNVAAGTIAVNVALSFA